MDNELLLLSGEDIPFAAAQLTVHPPRIKEISLIGEDAFWKACQFLKLSKEKLIEGDKSVLDDMSDFEILMSIISSPNFSQQKDYVSLLLLLLFPEYEIKIADKEIILFNKENLTRINNLNYDIFKDIIVSMFSLEDGSIEGDYNPVDKRAEKIAEKLRKRKEKIANQEGKNGKVSILSRYVSILSVGEQKDMNVLMNYTVYQLKDELKRFQLKQSFDMYVNAKMAGAQDLKEVDNWMDDIHS